MEDRVSSALPQTKSWASSHIRAHFPRPTSLLRPENYDFLALNAESGNNVIQFARRSSGCGKGVSGTVEGHGRSPMALSGVATTFKTGNASENQASPADSSISHKAGKIILGFASIFAGFWLGVAAVSAYVHFSGR